MSNEAIALLVVLGLILIVIAQVLVYAVVTRWRLKFRIWRTNRAWEKAEDLAAEEEIELFGTKRSKEVYERTTK